MKRYIVTSYIPGSDINSKCIKTLNFMAKKLKAKLIISETGANHKKDLGLFDFKHKHLQVTNGTLSMGSLLLSDIKVNVNKLDPLSGIETEVNNKGNILVAAPRHRFKSVARSLKHSSHPRGAWCTGTISKPYYKTTITGRKAQGLHQYGAILVETQGKNFQCYQLTFNGKGIHHLDKFYTTTKVSKSDICRAPAGALQISRVGTFSVIS